jgi:predicted lipopolysaccharide heptosyltransferase III
VSTLNVNAAPPASILLIKMRYIGDAVLVTPLLRALKQALPATRIDFLINRETAGVIKGQPHIDNLIAFDYDRAKHDLRYMIGFLMQIRRRGYDMAMDLTHNDRSALITFVSGAAVRMGFEVAGFWQKKAYTHRLPNRFGRIHTVDHHLEMAHALGLPVADIHPYLAVSTEDRRWIRAMLAGHGIGDGRQFVVIHPGARRWYKSWPPARFAQVADGLMSRYPVQVVLSGGPQDRETCAAIAGAMQQRAVNLSGQVPLEQLAALLRESELLIGNDSAPVHIATAVNTPVIALFGPTLADAWKPRRAHDRTVDIPVSCPCRPCGHSRPDCPLGREGYCMAQITADRVWQAVEAILDSKGFAR